MIPRRMIAFAAPGALALALCLPTAADAQPRGAQAPARGALAVPATQRPVTFAVQAPAPGGVLVLPLAAEGDLARRGASLGEAERAAVARALTSAKFTYADGKSLTLRGLGAWDLIQVVGLGEQADAKAYQAAGAGAGRALRDEAGAITVLAEGLPAAAVAELAIGLGLGEYRSDFHQAKARGRGATGPITMVSEAAPSAEALFRPRGQALVTGMAWARDVSNEPANILYPESFVARARASLAGVPGVSVEVLDVPAMERLGMGAILGVGQGSERPPRMLIMRYRGAGAPAAPVVLVGKGITFDTGGISIKPSANMGNMKMDMSGAASVTGAFMALAKAGAPVNVVAIAALAENMPDGRAIRPADVLTAMNGKTIEIVSTDAEGRLVLADALSWVDANLQPSAVVDVATLTGAVRQALGDKYAGLFSRHDALAQQLTAAGEAVGEPLWRLPLHPSYGTDISSTIADLRNGGGEGAGAGTGAHFIGEFISPDTPWAHLDIAGVAYGAATVAKPAGSAGFSVRLLERFVRDFQP
ncbi:MAG: leucyl aminopeptidase [Phenylobacterium sp.]|uniref:leucyl aminopeptidase n=1 Tax=Phenylobacterium sp. TaxID=1871053 RepID=UPI00271D2CE4|nr:leucyl aminopeptidase [Phenylobacterium sp.]MDO8901556.1 leucyl aminopeptidase [Phenylobacterium sp.]